MLCSNRECRRICLGFHYFTLATSHLHTATNLHPRLDQKQWVPQGSYSLTLCTMSLVDFMGLLTSYSSTRRTSENGRVRNLVFGRMAEQCVQITSKRFVKSCHFFVHFCRVQNIERRALTKTGAIQKDLRNWLKRHISAFK